MRLGLLNVFLKLSRTAFISWSLGVLVLVAVIIAFYPSVRDVGGALQAYLEAIPEVMMGALGYGDLSVEQVFAEGRYDFRAFVSQEYLSWMPAMLGVYAVFYCGGLVSREVERGTASMIFSHPLSRWQFILTKFTAFSVMIVGITCISWIALISLMPLVGAQGNIFYFGLAHLFVILIVLSIGSYCTLFSCIFREPGKSLAASGGVTFGLYFMNLLAPLSSSTEFLQKISPFYYYQAMPILYSGDANWIGVGVFLGMIVGGLLAAMWVFERNDLLN